MLMGFGYTRGTDLLKVQDDDFVIQLADYCRHRNITDVAMDVETRRSMGYGVKDLIHWGFRVIIVDPTYSPIHDTQVLPLNVHRNIDTLPYHFPDTMCIGRLLMQTLLSNKLQIVELGFVQQPQETYHEVLNVLPLQDLGWTETDTIRLQESPPTVIFKRLS